MLQGILKADFEIGTGLYVRISTLSMSRFPNLQSRTIAPSRSPLVSQLIEGKFL